MADRDHRKTRVEDIFAPNRSESSNIRAFKNKPAPKPPAGIKPLPKIGNYQPKSLLSAGHEDGSFYRKIDPEVTQSRNPELGRFQNGPLIMGDKDTLLHIEQTEDQDVTADPPSPKPRRKRRAPNAPVERQDSTEPGFLTDISDNQTRTNPLFGRSDDGQENKAFETQGEELHFSQAAPPTTQEQTTHSDVRNGANDRPELPARDNNRYPYIPPPDYDDQEETIEFGEEADTFEENQARNRVSLYKQYEGEDFGKYLNDDDFEFGGPGQWRPPPNSMHPPKHNKSHDKRFSRPKKHKKTDQNRNTIRDFTFTDSKIGWGDRTVKSTSAKGRYIKREKDRKRIDESFSAGPNYEQFLRDKNCMLPESSQSSDSGLGGGDDMMRDPRTYYHSQPKQMKKDGTISNMWQKLTWRFRRSVSISKYEPR